MRKFLILRNSFLLKKILKTSKLFLIITTLFQCNIKNKDQQIKIIKNEKNYCTFNNYSVCLIFV